MKLTLAQQNFHVGAIEQNTDKIINAIKTAQTEFNSDMIVFPEMCITGYPPEDLLLRDELYERVNNALDKIKQTCKNIYIVIGYPTKENDTYYNQLCVIYNGEILATHNKQELPNYGVFDEKRYFSAGKTPTVVNINNIKFGFMICEDAWHEEYIKATKKAGAEIIITINASPFHAEKPEARENIITTNAKQAKLPMIYVNSIGGQDELVFDGGSLIVNEKGEMHEHAAFCEEVLLTVNIDEKTKTFISPKKIASPLSIEERIYKVLVLGVRDYIEKNNFPSALIGISGGIDSALTLAIAVDAIGADRIEGVVLPSRYNSKQTMKDLNALLKNFNVKQTEISIEPMFKAFLKNLKKPFKGYKEDVTEENLQARIRGVLLMAISNKKGGIVLATGNKSEMAVGYATLYGDMVGGFAMLKDVPKTMVYRLAHYRNSIEPLIPESILTKAPSAELAKDQKDEDTLPPYDVLDPILQRYIEHDESVDTIVKAGFDRETVKRVVKMVDRNEYKRRQAPVGVRITQRAFGRDRRYPITSGFSG